MQMSHIEYNRWDVAEKAKYMKWIPGGARRILDIGCGRGEFLSLLSGKYEGYGCDKDEECVRLSSRFGECKVAEIGNLASIYREETFDLVTAFHVLEHLECPLAGLHDMRLITRGYLLLAVPHARFLCSEERDSHLYSWNEYSLRHLVREGGFLAVRMTSDRVNIFPRWLRLSPVLNRIILYLVAAPNELILLAKKR